MNVHGYVRVFRPDHPMAHDRGWALEHRVVAFDLGLLAGPSDRRHVHHRNHDRANNSPENLMVVTAVQHGQEHRTIDWQEAARLYESGLGTVEVAKRLGTHAGNVSKRLRELGVTMRHEPPNKIVLDEAVVVAMGREGVPWAAIAERFGVSRTPVERILVAAGVPRRRCGRPRAS